MSTIKKNIIICIVLALLFYLIIGDKGFEAIIDSIKYLGRLLKGMIDYLHTIN